jgi:hypothetical protein
VLWDEGRKEEGRKEEGRKEEGRKEEERKGEERRKGGEGRERESSFDLYHLPVRNLANQTATTGSDRIFGKHG